MTSPLIHALLKERLPAPSQARIVRIAAGVSQERLAAELGVSRRSVARWETGASQPTKLVRPRYAALLRELMTVPVR